MIAERLILVERSIPLGAGHGSPDLRCLRDARLFAALRGEGMSPCDMLFLDTETTGLAGGTGTVPFLVGMAAVDEDVLRIEQFFLTGFEGEAEMLRQVSARVARRRCLVTYNGKRFDVPLLVTRFRLSRQDMPFAALDHLDLLYPVRRAFGGLWPDCRLQTAERNLLGFARRGDIAGAMIPEAWSGFLRNGSTALLAPIVEHNRWDLVSLSALLPALSRVYGQPHAHGANVLAIALGFARERREEDAYRQLLALRRGLDQRGLLELARLHRRRGEHARAAEIWQELAARAHPEALARLAILCEHARGDLPGALNHAEALHILAPDDRANLRRIERLRRKLALAGGTSASSA